MDHAEVSLDHCAQTLSKIFIINRAINSCMKFFASSQFFRDKVMENLKRKRIKEQMGISTVVLEK